MNFSLNFRSPSLISVIIEINFRFLSYLLGINGIETPISPFLYINTIRTSFFDRENLNILNSIYISYNKDFTLRSVQLINRGILFCNI